MRIPAFASAVLGLLVAMAVLAACLPEKGAATGRGHELTPAGAGVTGSLPGAAQQVEPASRLVEPASPPSAAPPHCTTAQQAAASVTRTAPGSAVRQYDGADALAFIADHNADPASDPIVSGDEILLFTSGFYADHAVAIVMSHGCALDFTVVDYTPSPSTRATKGHE